MKTLEMLRLPNLKKRVLRKAGQLIDLGAILKCCSYKRANPKDHASLNLELNSWGLFLLVTTLLCAHSVTQWISFFHHIQARGLNVQACLHLNFLAIYTSSFVFSLQQILRPVALIDVQNEIHRMEKSFSKSYTNEPVLILILAATQGLLFVTPFAVIGLYFLDPTLPMFVVTTSFLKSGAMTFHDSYGAVTIVTAALLESFLTFSSLLSTITVGQPCVVIVFAMNAWMDDLRTRTKGVKILMSSQWILLDELYRRIGIFSVLCNCFWGRIIMPASAVMVVLASAGTLFCKIRLHGHLHLLVYAFFPIAAIFMVVGMLLGNFGQISKVHRNARDCMQEIVDDGRKLRARWVRNKGDEDGDEDMKFVGRKLRALRSFGVQIGIFGCITASTQFAMLDQIISYAILLLSL